MNNSLFQWISLFLQSVTAMSALGGVIAVLYVFHKQNKLKVNLECGLGSLGKTHGILIKAYNDSEQPLEFTKIGFSIGFFKKWQVEVVPSSKSIRQLGFPSVVPPYDTAYELVSWDEFEKKYEFIINRYAKGFLFSRFLFRFEIIRDGVLASFKCWVKTKGGHVIMERAEKQVLYHLEGVLAPELS